MESCDSLCRWGESELVGRRTTKGLKQLGMRRVKNQNCLWKELEGAEGRVWESESHWAVREVWGARPAHQRKEKGDDHIQNRNSGSNLGGSANLTPTELQRQVPQPMRGGGGCVALWKKVAIVPRLGLRYTAPGSLFSSSFCFGKRAQWIWVIYLRGAFRGQTASASSCISEVP